LDQKIVFPLFHLSLLGPINLDPDYDNSSVVQLYQDLPIEIAPSWLFHLRRLFPKFLS
jgi:hypothetical protein